MRFQRSAQIRIWTDSEPTKLDLFTFAVFYLTRRLAESGLHKRFEKIGVYHKDTREIKIIDPILSFKLIF